MFPETLSDLENRNHKDTQPRRRGEKGQSLVELALALPLMLFLLLGIAEIGNVIRVIVAVEAAAREGARAAAIGAPDYNGTRTVASTASTILAQSLDVNEQNTQVWIMRPLVSGSTGAYTMTEANWVCGYGEAGTVTATGPHGCTLNVAGRPSDSGYTTTDLLAEVNDASDPTPVNFTDTAGTRFVVVVVYYEAQTLTNTSLFNILNQSVPVRAYTILRQEVSSDAIDRLSNECPVYPIALIEPNFIAAQAGTSGTTATGQILPGALVSATPLTTTGTASTREFAFLAWDTSKRNNAAGLTTSLTPPGDSASTYVDPIDSLDTELQVGDTVYAYGAPVAAAGTAYDQLVSLANEDRLIRVIITGDTGSGGTFDVSRFGIIKIDSILTVNGVRTQDVVMEFISYETGCGAEDTGS